MNCDTSLASALPGVDDCRQAETHLLKMPTSELVIFMLCMVVTLIFKPQMETISLGRACSKEVISWKNVGVVRLYWKNRRYLEIVHRTLPCGNEKLHL